MCKLLIQNGSGSYVCKSLNYIRNQYHIHGERGNAIQISSISDVCDIVEDDEINVENIKCLLHIRDLYNSCVSLTKKIILQQATLTL